MKSHFRKSTPLPFLAVCLYVLAAAIAFAAPAANAVTHGQKAKIKGVIIARDGDAVKIQDKKDGSTKTFMVTDQTKIERDKSGNGFFGRTNMQVTALVPGLTVRVEGVSNAEGQVEAKTVRFNPDAFAVTVAQQQQIIDNRAATGRAQESANEGTAKADAAQSSADQAQFTANRGVFTAQAAGTLAAADAVEVSMLDQRVSDLSQYETVAQVGVYFPENGRKLDASSKASLDDLVSANSNLSGYVIEIAGYTSGSGSAQHNQKLSEERAAAVAQYLREKDDVPAWRISVPAGYGKTHPAADNSSAKGRALNRRVEVRILVSKGSQEFSQLSSIK